MHIVNNWNEFKFKDHLFFNCRNEINSIIQPLVKHFELDSFVFQKIYTDGSEIRLTNQPQWAEHFYTHKLYEKSVFETQAADFKKEFIVWANIPEHQPVLNEAKKFNIDHGLTLTNPTPDGVEFYFLGNTTNNHKISNKYISNIDLLQKFIPYFQQTACNLIKQGYNQRLLIKQKSVANNKTQHLSIDRAQFLMDIMPIHLTSRELDCAKLLAKGYTAKMIALELKISYRTVEEYINNLKYKTSSISKSELAKYFSQWF